MNKFLQSVGILFVTVFVAYFFLIDSVIKSQLEREGSKMLQAPFEIGSVAFHLFPTTLTLREVQLSYAQDSSTRSSTRNLVQAETLSLPLSLRDLLAHKLIVDNVDVHGLRFNQPRARQNAAAANANGVSTTRSPQLREALQHIQDMINHPLASNTLDPNASIAGALLADGFKPLINQIVAALNAVAAPVNTASDWQILIRRVNLDGALDFGSSSTNSDGGLHFAGTIDNITPQPQLFDAITQFDLHNMEGEPATLHTSGNLDKRKLTQASLRFDLSGFPLAAWSLCDDPELKIMIASASLNIQALLSLTGNQFDLNALAHFQQAHVDVANGDNEVARVVADVWRHTDAFDLNLQASGDLHNPILKLNSSLDTPLATALRQLQPASAFPQAAPVSNSP